MIYINTKTGAVIDSPLTISGGDWVIENCQNEIICNPKPTKPTKPNEVDEVDKVDEVDEVDKVEKKSEGLTKDEIIQELEAFGIEYNKNATKGELLALLVNN